MRLLLLLALVFMCTVQPASASDDWGKTGHRATGEIASQYLSKKAKKAIKKLLNGKSLAEVSTFGDEIKSDTLYRSFGPWHYVNVPFDKTYDTHPKSDRGDLIVGIEKCVSILKDDTASEADKAFYLKMLVHFIGDLHQPLHVGIGDDKGGNDFQVRWFRDGSNLHRVWDTTMIEDYGMSYTELAINAPELSRIQLAQMQSGTVIDWMEDSRTLVKRLYKETEVGDKLSYRYMYVYFPVVRQQLLKGGVRLAALLNDVLG